MADAEQPDLTALTVDLLRAYFATNTVEHGELAGIIRSTHEALKGIENPEPAAPAEPEFTPKVSARKSLASRDHIISLIDGKKYKTLKRHLASHGLTPEQYRERYNLPASYPMVAPSYSEHRRAVAEKVGLGRKPTKTVAEVAAPVVTSAPSAAAPTAKAKKAPAKPKAASAPAAKLAAAPKAVRAKKLAPVAVEPVSPAPSTDATPKKVVRKPMAKAATTGTETKAPVKRAPRKPKISGGPAAG